MTAARLTTLGQVGPYTLLESIGQGSGGHIFRARAEAPESPEVAVKLMDPARAEDEVHRARFRREIWFLLTHRAHPNILNYVDMGYHQELPYFVTEFVPGGSIYQRMRAGYRPSRQDSVSICVQVLCALDALHQNRVVHRDVKVSNILMRPDGLVVLGDFGIARHERLSAITLQGQPLGTVGYAAPEQRESPHGVGPAADLFSVGALLFRLLTRQRPADLALSQYSPAMLDVVPEGYRDVVARATRYSPEERYPSASAMSEALQEVLAADPQARVVEHEPGSLMPEYSL